MEMITKILLIMCLGLIMMLAFIIGVLISDDVKDAVLVGDINEENYLDNLTYNCTSENLEVTAFCLRYNIKEFYNYNGNNSGKSLTLEELKQEGGVCRQYAFWYKENIIDIGFRAKTIRIETEKLAHRFTIAWNDKIDSICILDQREVYCW